MGENHDRGRRFEERWAKMIGGQVQRGSGNQPTVKLDVRGSSVLWSCKATKHQSFSLTKALLDEALQATRGPGGHGVRPGVAVELGDGTIFACMPAEEMIQMMAEDEPIVISDKAAARKARAGR